MIPAWKLRQEWMRFKQQLSAIPEFFLEPIARRRHDRAFAAGFPCADGGVPQSGKIAIVLLYQPDGILDSTLSTLGHLQEHGYAPFVVSNTPISDADKTRLHPQAWRIIERPNFGYDMGGYRDGILQLLAWDITPQHLLILNDSIWFPTLSQPPLIPALEQSQADLSGTILRERKKIRFLESYLYHVPQRLFQSRAFQDFWRGLRITSNKYKVIRRGERGFSLAMQSAGKSVHGLFSKPDFLARTADMDRAFLEKTVQHAAHIYPEYEVEQQELLASLDDPAWPERAREHIKNAISRENIYSAFPYAMVHLNAYPILKKSNDRLAMLWRRAYLTAVLAGEIPAPPEPVMRELQTMCDQHADG